MGYPAYNLTTLQLPAPSSNMTKAEYKSAYGIDLDAIDIRSFKLVIFGKDKFPIDQIKEVEDGYEIYFNGHILSITDIVQTSDEVYDVVNSKPVYCHPISIEYTSQAPNGTNLYLALLLFDNSSEAYDTPAKLIAKLESIWNVNSNAIFPITGGIYYASDIIYIAQKIGIYGTTKSILALNTSSGALGYFTLSEYINQATIYDGVNKIN